MPRSYSNDLRVRVIEFVESGEARREAARSFRVGAATAIRWVQQWRATGSFAAKSGPRSPRSPLELHKAWLLDLNRSEPDLTLEEIRDKLADVHGLSTSASAISRFYLRQGITFKKNRARGRARPS
jgi:transposase